MNSLNFQIIGKDEVEESKVNGINHRRKIPQIQEIRTHTKQETHMNSK